ncbi:MAG: OmpA family protein [Pseudomonadota bacterium]
MSRFYAFLFLILCSASLALAEGSPSAERRLLAPHPIGPVGLFRTFSAERGFYGPGSFTMSVTSGYFDMKGFPIAGQNTKKLSGRVSVAYTPIAPIEIFASGWAFTNDNDTTVNLLQQVGNLDYGLKAAYDLGSEIALGPIFVGHFQKNATDLDFHSHAYTYDLIAAATLDRLRRNFPFRAHLNAGYRWDGTKHLLDVAAPEEARVAYGVLGFNAIIAAVGFEVPVKRVVFSAEYSTEQTFGTPNAGYKDKPQRVTLGLRYFPTKNEALALEAAGDIGFFATHDANRVVREPDWQLIAGLTYAFGAYGRVKEAQPQPAAQATPTAVLVGTVTEEKTNQPVGGAEIQLCGTQVSPIVTDSEKGRYRSYPLPDGDCKVTVSADGYDTRTESVKLAAAAEVRKDFVLGRAQPSKGVVLLQVKDSAGQGAKAVVSLPDLPQVQPMETDDSGQLTLRLPVGVYRIVADRGDERGESPSIEVIEGHEMASEIQIAPTDVKLEAKSITLKQSIAFVSGSDQLTDNSMKILDRVARLLKYHPEIRNVEIGGHTDSTGSAEANVKLSQRRADAVRAYLATQGVEIDRLATVGYGLSRPIASNATKQGRLANRRVEFKIIEK